MKKVVVLSVLFFTALSINHAQSYAGIYSPYNDDLNISKDIRSNDNPEIINSTVFLEGADFEPELTGLSLSPTMTNKTIDLIIESKTDKNFKVVLFNQLGTELKDFEVPSNLVNTINVDQYVPGNYYFLIHITDGTIKKKFDIVE